jgi:Type I phosphodiesterase / nucleotide pyrophosphatase
MPISQELENKIRANRLVDLPVEWADEMLFPYYQGLSLRNVPHTIAAALGVPLLNSAPLLNEVWQADVPQAERVVVFLMDGMGYRYLSMLAKEDSEIRQAVDDLTDGRGFIPLTSVAPSTTVVALSTLWTGGAPGATGIIGTLMFLSEISTLGNMLSFGPMAGTHAPDAFVDWGLAPENIVQMSGLSEHLAAAGIPTHTLTKRAYLGTGLSRILHRGSEHRHGHMGYSDMMLGVKNVLKETQGQRCYVGIYWEAVDALAHAYGAHSLYTHTEIRQQLLALRDLLNQPEIQDGKTLFLLLADHGHYDSLQPIELSEDAIFMDAMTMSVYGDERHAYMQVRHGTLDAVKERIDSAYADKMTYIDAETALDSGYLGEELSPMIRRRIGDLILLPRLGHIISDPVLGTLPMISRHAGLSDWEMLIPFMWKMI